MLECGECIVECCGDGEWWFDDDVFDEGFVCDC